MIARHILGVLCFHLKKPTTNFRDLLRPHLYLDGSGIQGTILCLAVDQRQAQYQEHFKKEEYAP
jgi:hypothetical protein